MSFVLILLLFMFMNPLIRMVSYYSPFLGMLCYMLIIVAVVSFNRRRVRRYQRNFYQQNQTQQNADEPYENASNGGHKRNTSDAIDVEFSEEEVS